MSPHNCRVTVQLNAPTHNCRETVQLDASEVAIVSVFNEMLHSHRDSFQTCTRKVAVVLNVRLDTQKTFRVNVKLGASTNIIHVSAQ
jgi:hypothetical protein